MAQNAEQATFPPLAWHDQLVLNLDYMDDTHREFVELLARVSQVEDKALLALWDEVIAHTQAHFEREDRWMAQTQFGPGACHTREHDQMLLIMREVAKRAAAGNLAMVRQMGHELGIWFDDHAQGMDAGLAEHLRALGFDPESSAEYQPSEASVGASACG